MATDNQLLGTTQAPLWEKGPTMDGFVAGHDHTLTWQARENPSIVAGTTSKAEPAVALPAAAQPSRLQGADRSGPRQHRAGSEQTAPRTAAD